MSVKTGRNKETTSSKNLFGKPKRFFIDMLPIPLLQEGLRLSSLLIVPSNRTIKND
jgi:hypothetical protein